MRMPMDCERFESSNLTHSMRADAFEAPDLDDDEFFDANDCFDLMTTLANMFTKSSPMSGSSTSNQIASDLLNIGEKKYDSIFTEENEKF